MTEWGRSFLYSGIPDRLESPGPIPEEYSRQYQSQNQDTVETDRLTIQHPTTTWQPEAQTSQAGAAIMANTGFHPIPRPPSLFQPISHNAQGPFLAGLQANRRAYGMAGTTGRIQQEENRPLQPPPQRVETQHMHNNGNQLLQGRPSLSFIIEQQSQAQRIYQASQLQPQLQLHSTGHTQQRSNPRQSLQPSESRPSTSDSRRERPSVKHLTCWWWNEKGQCRYSVDECLYAHHKTGRVADAPRQVKPGEPPVAGKRLMRALQEEAGETAQRGPEREMGILQAQNKALREAYVALSSTTSQSLSAISTLRQSVTRLTAEVMNVERGRASHHQHSTTPASGIYQVDAQLARALRLVEDQGLLAGVVEGQTRARVARVEESLVGEGLGQVVEEGKGRVVVPQGMR